MIGSLFSYGLTRWTFGGLLNDGVFQLILIIGAFTWFYPARIVRTQIQSLRAREFVEAAQMVGAKDSRIMRTHLLPHVVPSLLAVGTLLVATNVMIEVGVTFLGAGHQTADGELGHAARPDLGLDPEPESVQPGDDAAVADAVPLGRDLRDGVRAQPVRRRTARGDRPAGREVSG